MIEHHPIEKEYVVETRPLGEHEIVEEVKVGRSAALCSDSKMQVIVGLTSLHACHACLSHCWAYMAQPCHMLMQRPCTIPYATARLLYPCEPATCPACGGYVLKGQVLCLTDGSGEPA